MHCPVYECRFFDQSVAEARGRDFDWLVDQVARALNMSRQRVLAPGKHARSVKARSLLCYWGVRELGMTTVALAERLKLAQPTVSQAVPRGERVAGELGLRPSDGPAFPAATHRESDR